MLYNLDVQIFNNNQTPSDLSLFFNLYALDIETACALNCTNPCKHALYPHTSKITVVAIVNDTVKIVFWNLTEFAEWVKLFPYAKFVGHNFSFDLKHLNFHNVNIPVDAWHADTMLMSQIKKEKIPDQWLKEYEAERKQLNKNLPKGKRHRVAKGNSLKTLAPYYLKVPKFWEAVDDHANEEYVLKDTQYTWELYKLFTKYLTAQKTEDFFYKYQMRWARAMFQLGGVSINQEGFKKLEEECKAKVASLHEQLNLLWYYGAEKYREAQEAEVIASYEEQLKRAELNCKPGKFNELYSKINERCAWQLYKIPQTLNIDSPKQMLWLFKDFYNWNVKSLDGQTSTGKTLLQKLADEGHEDAKLFLEYKAAQKLLSSFIEPYKTLEHEGKLWPSFNSFGARTGRTSCQNPNLQQCPPSIRKLIVAKPKHKFIIKDESAIEPRIIAYLTEEESIVKLFQQPHADFHALTTLKFDLVPQDTAISDIKKLHKPQRDAAKEAGLATLYGAGKIRLLLSLQKRGIKKTEEECHQMIQKLRKGLPQVTKYKRELDKQAERGEAIKSIFGLPIWYSNPEDVYMQAFNTQVQGSASQLVVEAVARLQERFKQLGMKSRPVMAIHDEIVVEAPDEEVEAAEKLVETIMTGYNLKTKYGLVPLEVEGAVSQNWSK